MKRSIYILTTLMFICLVGYLTQEFLIDFPKGFKRGANNAFEQVHSLIAHVTPIESITTAYQIHSVVITTNETVIIGLMLFPGFLSVIAVGVAFVCFVRLLISLRKQEVFIHENVLILRIIAGAVLFFSLTALLSCYIDYSMAKEALNIPDYQLKGFGFPYKSGIQLGLLLALFGEIFAYGIRLKEEQEFII